MIWLFVLAVIAKFLMVSKLDVFSKKVLVKIVSKSILSVIFLLIIGFVIKPIIIYINYIIKRIKNNFLLILYKINKELKAISNSKKTVMMTSLIKSFRLFSSLKRVIISPWLFVLITDKGRLKMCLIKGIITFKSRFLFK